MDKIYVCGVGMTPFGRFPDTTIKDLTRQSVIAAMGDAGCGIADIQAAYFTASTSGYLQGQNFIPGQIALRSMGFEGIPMYNLENACASGSSAFHLAAQALRSGEQDIVLAVGAEKMYIEDKAKMFSAFDSGWDIETLDENRDNLLALGEGVEVPEGTTSPKPYSVFMDVYAAFCRQHMRNFGTTQRQIAAVCAKNHQHSVHNENAQFRDAYTIEQVLAAPPITYPLTLPMCAPISDGSAAVILCNEAGLKRMSGDKSRAVRILASVVQTGSGRDPSDYQNHITAVAARALYEKAGLWPQDVDVVEVHDATAMGEIIQAENLQLVPFGEAGPAAERGEFTIGGRVPINPSGGLESKGHPISATGLGQIHELVTQLRGEAGSRQVEGATVALQENGGGLYGYEEAVAVLNLFAR
ncbi:MAG: thiolase family protein [Haliea sp.]|nr:thiolase family protein [Haliea sp.]